MRLIKKFQEFFDNIGWKYTEVQEGMLRLGISGDGVNWQAFAQGVDEKNMLLFYSAMEPAVPNDKLAGIMDFFTRVNDGLIYGNFEINMASQIAIFKTSNLVNADDIPHTIFSGLVGINTDTVNKTYHEFMKVMYGGASPNDAANRVRAAIARVNPA